MAPQNIKAHQKEKVLEIIWSESHSVNFPYQFLRGRCSCANCVHEMTGQRMFDINDADPEVKPLNMEFSGNYALKIYWSDGHSTGLYAWKYFVDLEDELSQS